MEKKCFKGRALAISVLAISLILLISSTAPAVLAACPSIALSPSYGKAGSSVTVNGQGFAGNQIVTITFDGKTVTTIKTGSNGKFSATFTVPTTSTKGYHLVTATYKCELACAWFCVNQLFVTPEYPFAALAALVACFGALLVYKRKSLPSLHLNIHR